MQFTMAGLKRGPALWNKLGDDLTVLMDAIVAAKIGRAWCPDFGHHAANEKVADLAKVGDEMTEALRSDLSEDACVEPTTVAGLENERSRTSTAFGLTSQAFTERCELRTAQKEQSS